MKKNFPEMYRVRQGKFRSSTGELSGMFNVPNKDGKRMKVLVSDGDGWLDLMPPPIFEHVSVSLESRCPTWDEMCLVKDLFWEPEELVVQYHPPKSVYVNFHPFVLHLWKPIGVIIPLPPKETLA